MATTAILVDDEPHLVDYLAGLLERLWPELEILGVAHSGREALSLAAQVQPDIAFMDIHMPGMSGLQVAEALPVGTRLVFVTAFEEYAVDAFQRAAVDYLLKPVTPERLQHTIDRLRDAPTGNRDQLLRLLRDPGQPPQYLQWIRAGFDDTTQLVPVQDVVYFQADQKYTTVITRDAQYLVRRSIKELAEQLDPDQFWRIHRGIIVRVEQITSAKRDLRGRYTLSLRDHPATIRCSQNYGHLFKHM